MSYRENLDLNHYLSLLENGDLESRKYEDRVETYLEDVELAIESAHSYRETVLNEGYSVREEAALVRDIAAAGEAVKGLKDLSGLYSGIDGYYQKAREALAVSILAAEVSYSEAGQDGLTPLEASKQELEGDALEELEWTETRFRELVR